MPISQVLYHLNTFFRSWEAAEHRTAAVPLFPQTPGFNSTQCHAGILLSQLLNKQDQTRQPQWASVWQEHVPDFFQSTGWPISHSQIMGTLLFSSRSWGLRTPQFAFEILSKGELDHLHYSPISSTEPWASLVLRQPPTQLKKWQVLWFTHRL